MPTATETHLLCDDAFISVNTNTRRIPERHREDVRQDMALWLIESGIVSKFDPERLPVRKDGEEAREYLKRCVKAVKGYVGFSMRRQATRVSKRAVTTESRFVAESDVSTPDGECITGALPASYDHVAQSDARDFLAKLEKDLSESATRRYEVLIRDVIANVSSGLDIEGACRAAGVTIKKFTRAAALFRQTRND